MTNQLGNTLNQQFKQTHEIRLNHAMQHSLQILSMNALDLARMVTEELAENPLLESTGDWSLSSSFASYGLSDNIHSHKGQSLEDELLLQLHVLSLPQNTMRIAQYIITSLDGDGYLKETGESIAKVLGCTVFEFHQALDVVQSLEPHGIAASSLKECLFLQLKYAKDSACAIAIVENHLPELAENDFRSIADQTGYAMDEVLAARDIIRQLSPKPGSEYGHAQMQASFPEIEIIVDDGQILVKLCDDLPHIAVSTEFDALTGTVDQQTQQYLLSKRNSAQQLVAAIERRRLTLLRLATCIANHQRDFFMHGHPCQCLTRKSLARELSLSESTVSRALAGGALLFNAQAIPYSFFFPSGSSKGSSSAQIKHRIVELIKNEDKSKPYRDEDISRLLKDAGLQVATRTVGKYRSELGLLSHSQRKLKQSRPPQSGVA